MGNQNHRENPPNKKTKRLDFRINDSGSRSLILKSWFVVCFVGFLYGFGYSLVMQSWLSCLFWFSRWFGLPIGYEILVFLFVVDFLYGFGYPSRLHTCIALVLSMVLQIVVAIKVVSEGSHILVHIPVVFTLGCLWCSLVLLMVVAFTSAFNCGVACPP